MKMKYCKTTTLEHPIAKQYVGCVIDYNQLIFDEGYLLEPIFKNEEIVINLDLVEKLYSEDLKRLEKKKSMDSAFCVSNAQIKKIVLVEYKFNKEDFKSLRLADMEGKVAGSVEILANHMPIYYHYYFVVQNDLLHEAINRFYRMNPNPGREYIAISIELLKELFF